MKVNKIVVVYSRTVQMRQFEPVQIMGTIEAQIDVGDDPKREFQRLYKMIHDQMELEVRMKKIERKKSFLEDEEGLEKSV